MHTHKICGKQLKTVEKNNIIYVIKEKCLLWSKSNKWYLPSFSRPLLLTWHFVIKFLLKSPKSIFEFISQLSHWSAECSLWSVVEHFVIYKFVFKCTLLFWVLFQSQSKGFYLYLLHHLLLKLLTGLKTFCKEESFQLLLSLLVVVVHFLSAVPFSELDGGSSI